MYSVKNLSHNKNLDGNLVDNFLDFVTKELGLDQPFSVYFIDDKKNAKDALGKTAMYNPGTKSVYVYATNRHPKDILRSVAHELMHHKQHCDGHLQNMSLEDAEMQANEAGYLLRKYEDGLKQDKLKEQEVQPGDKCLPHQQLTPIGTGRNLCFPKGISAGLKPLSPINDYTLRDLLRISIARKKTKKAGKISLWSSSRIPSKVNLAVMMVPKILRDFGKVRSANTKKPTQEQLDAARRLYYLFDPPEGKIKGRYITTPIDPAIIKKLEKTSFFSRLFKKAIELTGKFASSEKALAAQSNKIKAALTKTGISRWSNKTASWWNSLSFVEQKRYLLLIAGAIPPELAATVVGVPVGLVATPGAGVAAGGAAALIPVSADVTAGVSFLVEEPTDVTMALICFVSAFFSGADAAKVIHMRTAMTSMKVSNEVMVELAKRARELEKAGKDGAFLAFLNKIGEGLEKYNLPTIAQMPRYLYAYLKSIARSADAAEAVTLAARSYDPSTGKPLPTALKNSLASDAVEETKGVFISAYETGFQKSAKPYYDDIIQGSAKVADDFKRVNAKQIEEIFLTGKGELGELFVDMFPAGYIDDILKKAEKARKELGKLTKDVSLRPEEMKVLGEYDSLSALAYRLSKGDIPTDLIPNMFGPRGAETAFSKVGLTWGDFFKRDLIKTYGPDIAKRLPATAEPTTEQIMLRLFSNPEQFADDFIRVFGGDGKLKSEIINAGRGGTQYVDDITDAMDGTRTAVKAGTLQKNFETAQAALSTAIENFNKRTLSGILEGAEATIVAPKRDIKGDLIKTRFGFARTGGVKVAGDVAGELFDLTAADEAVKFARTDKSQKIFHSTGQICFRPCRGVH